MNSVKILEEILDYSGIFSFDRTGFERHSKKFRRGELDVDMTGRVCLVTGANSGIGLETAYGLAIRGAKVFMICRNQERAMEALESIRERIRKNQVILKDGEPNLILAIVDMAELSSIRKFVAGFQENRVDVLVHNAGALPLTRTETHEGLETTFATHVVGPFLLTQLLLPLLRNANRAKVISVSSGGMYLQKLDLKNIQSVSNFNGVTAYANTKRAEVILSELWSQHIPESEVIFCAMHPGWADTPGVRKSLPRFWKLLKNRLRTPEQGADTVLWLAVCNRSNIPSGKFWFDREPVSTHLGNRLFNPTLETEKDQKELWGLCRAYL